MKGKEVSVVRIGIAGAGAIAAIHADAFKMFPEDVQVVAVADIFIDKAKALIDKKGLRAEAFGDIHEMIDKGGIDAVSICLPPSDHASVSLYAMDRGKHVLCEKPMASSLEECDAVIRSAEKNGVIFFPVCQNRFKTPIERVARLKEGGRLGKLLFGEFRSLWWRGENYYDIWWRGTWEKEAGGCFTSHAVHYIDLMVRLLGMPDSVRAVTTNVGHHNSECEDAGCAIFMYGSVPVVFISSLVTSGEPQSIHLDFEKASIDIPWSVSASTALPNGFPLEDEEGERAIDEAYHGIPELELEGHPAQLKAFIDTIEGRSQAAVDAADGRHTIELIMGIYLSSATGEKVTFPIGPDSPVYTTEGLVRTMPRFFRKTKSLDNFSTSEITLGRNIGK